MEYGFTQKLFGYFYHNSCMKQAKAQHLSLNSKAIKNEYKAVLERADDIGKSHLMSSYCMGAYFIALNRKTSLSPEECFSLDKKGVRELLRSQEMMDICLEHAEATKAAAGGEGYEISSHVGTNRVNASVRADTCLEKLAREA